MAASPKTLESCITPLKILCQKFGFFLNQLLKFICDASSAHKKLYAKMFSETFHYNKKAAKIPCLLYKGQPLKNGCILAYQGAVNKYDKLLSAIFASVFVVHDAAE